MWGVYSNSELSFCKLSLSEFGLRLWTDANIQPLSFAASHGHLCLKKKRGNVFTLCQIFINLLWAGKTTLFHSYLSSSAKRIAARPRSTFYPPTVDVAPLPALHQPRPLWLFFHLRCRSSVCHLHLHLNSFWAIPPFKQLLTFGWCSCWATIRVNNISLEYNSRVKSSLQSCSRWIYPI